MTGLTVEKLLRAKAILQQNSIDDAAAAMMGIGLSEYRALRTFDPLAPLRVWLEAKYPGPPLRAAPAFPFNHDRHLAKMLIYA